jgi:MarR family transcriptional regulator for hemolysin
MKKPDKKRVARTSAARGSAHPGTRGKLVWMPDVSSTGELFLRRRELAASGEPGVMNYPFSQGLTFVARRWRNLMNAELRAAGQSQARWGTLYWINVFGDSVNQTELADRIGVEQPTLGRILRDLEAEGLIERAEGRDDRRARVIRLTAAAKPVMRQIDRIQNRVRARLLNGVSPRDLGTCLGVFAKILANMDHADRVGLKRPA